MTSPDAPRPLTADEVDRERSRHVETTSWPSTRDSTDARLQADGYFHYCKMDFDEPWPCMRLRLLATLDAARSASPDAPRPLTAERLREAFDVVRKAYVRSPDAGGDAVDAAIGAALNEAEAEVRATISIRTAIESWAARSADEDEDKRFRSIVEQAARMGSCSQTHHGFISDAARKLLDPRSLS